MRFVTTTLAVAAGTILGGCTLIKIVTSKTAIDAMKDKAKDIIQDVVEDSVRNIFNFRK